MAEALIIDDAYGVEAKAYYEKIPDEPTSAKASLSVESVHSIPKTSLLTTLESIQKVAKAGTDLVLVSHGNESGLTMGLTPKFGRTAKTNNLQILLSQDTPEKIADKFSMKPDIMKDLLAKAEAVRKIGLGHVAFRGCSIGAEVRNLNTLKEFLGATEVSGTSLLSTFGHVRPTVPDSKKLFDANWMKFAKNGHRYEGKDGGRVIFVHRPSKEEALKDNLFLILESKKLLLEWLRVHFLASATQNVATAMENNARVHYLWRSPAVMPLDGRADPSTVGYNDFMFFAK